MKMIKEHQDHVDERRDIDLMGLRLAVVVQALSVSLSVIEIPIAYSAARDQRAAVTAIEIAQQQPRRRARRAANQFEIGFG